MSPVMIYLPVSPVAPPKRTTLDLETDRKRGEMGWWVTLSDSVAETGEGDLAEDLNFLHHL